MTVEVTGSEIIIFILEEKFHGWTLDYANPSSLKNHVCI